MLTITLIIDQTDNCSTPTLGVIYHQKGVNTTLTAVHLQPLVCFKCSRNSKVQHLLFETMDVQAAVIPARVCCDEQQQSELMCCGCSLLSTGVKPSHCRKSLEKLNRVWWFWEEQCLCLFSEASFWLPAQTVLLSVQIFVQIDLRKFGCGFEMR